jgi:hypothetical protein
MYIGCIYTIMHGLKTFLGLPNIHGAIDDTYFPISKSYEPFNEKNYYYKSRG